MNVKKAVLGVMIATAGGALLSQAALADGKADKEPNSKTGDSATKSKESTGKARNNDKGGGNTDKSTKSCPADKNTQGTAQDKCSGCGKG